MSIVAQRNVYDMRHSVETVNMKRSLLRWKSQGFPLDPDNPDHCEAYRTVKNNSLARVSAQSVVLALETGKRLASGGVSCELNVYGVPVVNFPLGLPADLKEFSKLADDLEMFTGANVDLSSYYLLDCSVARQRLGLNVTTFTFSQNTQNNDGFRPATGGLGVGPANCPAMRYSRNTGRRHRPRPATSGKAATGATGGKAASGRRESDR